MSLSWNIKANSTLWILHHSKFSSDSIEDAADLVYSFFQEAQRITDANYIPIEADVLRARTKTTGIYETRFTMGQLSIQYVHDGSLCTVSNSSI
jgi:hypothetical protein